MIEKMLLPSDFQFALALLRCELSRPSFRPICSRPWKVHRRSYPQHEKLLPFIIFTFWRQIKTRYWTSKDTRTPVPPCLLCHVPGYSLTPTRYPIIHCHWTTLPLPTTNSTASQSFANYFNLLFYTKHHGLNSTMYQGGHLNLNSHKASHAKRKHSVSCIAVIKAPILPTLQSHQLFPQSSGHYFNNHRAQY